MAVIHNHVPAEHSDNGMGFFLGVVLLIAFLVFLFYYGLPVFQNTTSPQLNVPSKIDVNVNQK